MKRVLLGHCVPRPFGGLLIGCSESRPTKSGRASKRLPSPFFRSKKWTNHEAALGLYFAHYNFCHKHRTLKGRSPAMAAGLTDHVWTVAELLEKISG